ncbi:phosphinothricin acetyltransferase [Dysgonomonas hofstadii]|uniref:Phosphinothricin acetyltransferase n=1 Tax=Dysgonomonas hofstadii TaxID=637886 RepID=A0A840CWK4_9BACT|nr:GNAT family N-acetyltransferase [Dysgonomonas hofstadii]MBB4037984.1 phosphinothricin acetyltransferase [Dysgonomonas hofstadii]
MIRDITIADASRIADIYNYYIRETIITFEYDVVSPEEIQNRIKKIQAKGFPFFVYENDGEITGYAYLNNWRERVAYDITLETSVYLDSQYTGSGIGSVLYKELIERARKINIHSLIGVVSLPNEASQKLHQKFEFRLVGNFRESGVKFDKLIDVEFWQLIL